MGEFGDDGCMVRCSLNGSIFATAFLRVDEGVRRAVGSGPSLEDGVDAETRFGMTGNCVVVTGGAKPYVRRVSWDSDGEEAPWSAGAASGSFLVRIHFADETAWAAASAAAAAESADGFRAYVSIVDDSRWEGVSVADLRVAALAGEHAAVLFIADEEAQHGEFPIQIVDLLETAHPPFRCLARELWAVDNNLNLANMDWEEFAGATDLNGVYRGSE